MFSAIDQACEFVRKPIDCTLGKIGPFRGKEEKTADFINRGSHSARKKLNKQPDKMRKMTSKRLAVDLNYTISGITAIGLGVLLGAVAVKAAIVMAPVVLAVSAVAATALLLVGTVALTLCLEDLIHNAIYDNEESTRKALKDIKLVGMDTSIHELVHGSEKKKKKKFL